MHERNLPSHPAPNTPGTLTPSFAHLTNTRASANIRCLLKRASKVGCLYAFRGRTLSAHSVEGERNVVRKSRPSAPWVMSVTSVEF
jgi:hypothetical protein